MAEKREESRGHPPKTNKGTNPGTIRILSREAPNQSPERTSDFSQNGHGPYPED